ncbi:glycosyltransferase family 4 protein [Leptolyngbya sp. NK1-12]|uniref:Glycosyltransferase family 4 protein n=1 Tax=Leptolyngbya sp. NK1-12 TaxID=2547451 RepID=A0AA96WQC3_9CYAN|nr:glycosyltransferase family 4 protein [Leptolyngbya sp. NK1-12]WNZ27306.1 glycosyltransferase family 4 protein [Leptolyngbya sp. NK1-12]
MSVTLAHLMPAPFVQQVGRALFEAEMLDQFATTLVDHPDTAWLKTAHRFAKLLKFDLAHQLSRRAVSEFPVSLVKSYALPELLRLLVARIDQDKRLTDVVFHWGLNQFDHWVAKQIPGSQAVYGYEYGCLATFQAAKQQNIARIYDVPSPEHDFVENLLEKEFRKFPELQSPYRQYCRARQEIRTERRRQEWQLADLIIANSEFTKASYVAAGVDENKVRVVPYGAPSVHPEAYTHSVPNNVKVRFLWAGTFSVRKGAHYLLQAWKQLHPEAAAQLDVYGAMGLPESLLRMVSDSVYMTGTVPRSELYPIYRRSDVLVFPTLCDGFGMVVTEAFAQGLPVITTDRAGAADLVQHGVNGLIIPAGDVQALAEALEWCITHRLELREMRQAALETAKNWQWSDYRHRLIQQLEAGLMTAGYSL